MRAYDELWRRGLGPACASIDAGGEACRSRPVTPIQRLQSAAGNHAVTRLIAEQGLGGAGQPLPFLEQLQNAFYPHDLRRIRAHVGRGAAEASRRIGASAYTRGEDIAFRDAPDLATTAHEVAHVIQQRAGVSLPGGVGQLDDPYEREAERVADQVATGIPVRPDAMGGVHGEPGGVPGGAVQMSVSVIPDEQFFDTLKVAIIGAPSPAEIRLGHPYQFVHAAMSQVGVDSDTVWLVERSGYELGGVDLSVIESGVGAGSIRWVSSESQLIDSLNFLPAQSIRSLDVFSHGLPGEVHLRHGWEESRNQADYGLDGDGIEQIRPELFSPTAQIRVDSCRSGAAPIFDMSIAEALAEQTGRPVRGWTGRTSYGGINDAQGQRSAEVEPSLLVRGGGLDRRELPAFLLDQSDALITRVDPVLSTFVPDSWEEVDSVSDDFEFYQHGTSEAFEVPSAGEVVVSIDRPTASMEDDDSGWHFAPRELHVSLRRVEPLPALQLDPRTIQIGTYDATFDSQLISGVYGQSEIWSGVAAGEWVVDLWLDEAETRAGGKVEGDLEIEVYRTE